MFKAIKIRLYPNKGQCCLIEQTLGCCRLIYNKGLEKRIADYKKRSFKNKAVNNVQSYKNQIVP